MSGIEPYLVVRVVVLIVAVLMGLLLPSRVRSRSTMIADSIGWTGTVLALMALATGETAASYLIAAALGFGLGNGR